jgi:NAD(P)-dependent dehydrogenase (short-subunit alcohol dehydrogenase family)
LSAAVTAFVHIGQSVAAITGAGSGIGRATAISLARRGCRVVVSDVDGARAEAVASEIRAAGGAAAGVVCDVTKLEHLEALRDACLERFGGIDIVMNNVGVLAVGPAEAIPLDAWQRIVDINLLGVVRSNLVFLPHLIEQRRGHVVNTASTAGLLPYGFDRLPYTATKHAIVGLSEALALYLRPQGIGVSCLCPAGVRTNIVEQIQFFGGATAPRGPALPMVDADVVGELVADAIDDGDRFLVLTAPDEVHAELVDRARDVDHYVIARSDEAG